MEEGHFSFYEVRASCQRWKSTFPESVFFLARNKSDTFYDITIKRQVEQIVRLSFYLCEVYLESHE